MINLGLMEVLWCYEGLQLVFLQQGVKAIFGTEAGHGFTILFLLDLGHDIWIDGHTEPLFTVGVKELFVFLNMLPLIELLHLVEILILTSVDVDGLLLRYVKLLRHMHRVGLIRSERFDPLGLARPRGLHHRQGFVHTCTEL